jgi:hypothetical protein
MQQRWHQHCSNHGKKMTNEEAVVLRSNHGKEMTEAVVLRSNHGKKMTEAVAGHGHGHSA